MDCDVWSGTTGGICTFHEKLRAYAVYSGLSWFSDSQCVWHKICFILERIMHFERCETDMKIARERHPHVSGDPAHGDSLDARVRGHDYRAHARYVRAPECMTRSREPESFYHDAWWLLQCEW